MDSNSGPIETLSPLKQALLEIRELRARLDANQQARREPVAIVGVGCRFPGQAGGPDAFWRLLRDGVDAVRETPPQRWDADAYYDPDPQMPGKLATRWGGFIDGVDRFDAHFFGITPREAMSMDPQQRLLLEVTWEALEHAGQSPQALSGSLTGVFVGIGTNDYSYLRLMRAGPQTIDAYLAMGASHSVASGRLSYVLGLQGPSVSLDTACSSSLLAVHLAVQSLRRQECCLALAGGVNLMLMPEMTMTLSQARMMAADGRCKTFDARADGFVRAEGCGMVVLKRLSDALANRDPILALIRGSATNQDGRSNGLTAPNGLAQEAVLRAALADAGVDAAAVDYVEAHGTGTALGDPIEVRALGAVYGHNRPATRPLALGSVKTNVGHMEAGAGVAGLIKVALALQNEEIPPHLHLQERSPHIPWDALPPIDIPTQRAPWPRRDSPRLAAVSSFGFSGTNVHVILEEAPRSQPSPTGDPRPLSLLTLSAHSEAALQQLADRYTSFLASAPAAPAFADVCYTAAAGRAHFAHRAAVVAATAAEAAEKLSAFSDGQEAPGLFHGRLPDANPPEIAFLFTGHGAQYVNMGRALYETAPVFRQALDDCAERLRAFLPRPLLPALFPPAPAENAASLLDTMTYGQPALFALEYALATLWRSWGVVPAMLLGHSVGEYVAACIADVFSLEDGLKLVCARGRLMDSLPQNGAMAALFAAEARVAAAVAPHGDRLAIAAVNGADNVVISGEKGAVQSVIAALAAEGVQHRPLAVGAAAHSPLLDPILDAFAQTAAEIRYDPPAIGLISGRTGRPLDQVDAAYWRAHLRQPVRFADALETLYRQGHRHFLEIGPAPVLCGMGRRWETATEGCIAAGPEDAGAVWLPSLRPEWRDWQQMLESAAALYTAGAALDWEQFDRPYHDHRRRLPLPTYPWQRQSYWLAELSSEPPESPVTQTSLWEMAVAAGDHQADHGPLNLDLDAYHRREERLARLATAHILAALQTLGAYTQAGEAHTVDSLLARCQIMPTYQGLVARWLENLTRQGLLQQQDPGVFANPAPLPPMDPDALLKEALTIASDGPELPLYVARCGQKLTAVLTGRESPLATLFPDGSYDTADYLYHKSAPARYGNGIAREVTEAVARHFAGRPQRKPLRVLEVGAGTGGTTAALLPVLPGEDTRYTFTDLSEFFFARAEERFAAYPFLRFGLLNLEEDPQPQGYERHSVDLLVGANVFHATQDLERALDNACSLLAPGGLLLLYETTQHPTWFDVSIGLIEGWSRFDDAWRQGNPLLTPAKWREALLAHGFAAAQAWPEAGSAAAVLGVHVLLAQTPTTTPPDEDPRNGGREEMHAPPSAPRPPLSRVAPAVHRPPSAVLLAELQEALPADQLDGLVDYVRRQVLQVTRSDPARAIGRRDRLMDLGVDSLMAVELRSSLGAGLGLEQALPATLIFDYPTIEAIAAHLQQALFGPSDPQPAPEARASAGSATTSIAELSEEEVEALLLKNFGDIS